MSAGCRDGAASEDARRVAAHTADSVALVARRDSVERVVRAMPGYVVDSILPTEEALRRFRGTLPDATPPTTFTGGAPTRQALIRKFITAVERRDTVGLRQLHLGRAEFAYLVYPGSIYTREPYRQSPDIVWYLLTASSDVGAKRLLDRLGGQPLTLAGWWCDASPERDGAVRYWRGCRVRLVHASGDTVSARLFDVIVERDGRYKFASYKNDI